MVRFLHTADLHLGSPLRTVASRSKQLRDQLQQATYTALGQLIDVALEETVDFVVFAGDIYDQEARSVKANSFFVEQLRRLDDADIPAYIIHGNHDPLGAGAELFDLPDSAHVFGADEVGVEHYPSEDDPEALVLGQSYQRRAENRKMYPYYTPPRDDLPAIGLLHTGLDPDSGRYVPCSLADLQGKEDIDYWALGHIHQREVFDGAPRAVFPGIPQGRHVNEAGVGGSVLVEIEEGGSADLTFVPAGPVVWDQREVPLDDADGPETVDDLHDLLMADAESLLDRSPDEVLADVDMTTLDPGWSPDGYVVRWTISGRTPLHEALEDPEEASDYLEAHLRRDFGEGSPFLWTESVRFRTARPLPDLDAVLDEDPVLQEFVDLVDEARDDEAIRAELRDRCRKIWYDPEDPENVRPDRFPLEDDDIDRFLDDAKNLIVDRILEKRETHVAP